MFQEVCQALDVCLAVGLTRKILRNLTHVTPPGRFHQAIKMLDPILKSFLKDDSLEAQLPIYWIPVLKSLYNFVLSVTQGPTIWVPGLLGTGD